MAELTDDEKDAISHRGRAARELLAWLSTRSTAAPATRPCPQPRRRGLDRVELDPDRAQGRRGHSHRIGGDPDRGAALGHRPAGEPDRVLLRPPRRGARGRRPPLRPREVRERRGRRRGDVDPGRLGGDRLRGGALADRGPRAREPGGSASSSSVSPASPTSPSRAGCSARRARRRAPRSRATPRTCAPTPTRRSACSSASRS